MLGVDAASTFGELPFLMKVLAAAKPLSIQAHPGADQARAGFDRENAAGIPLDAPQRTYVDPKPKPELICALTPFHALCGFRSLAETRDLFDDLGAGVEPVAERLAARGDEAAVIAETMSWLLREASPEVTTACVDACRMLDRPGWALEAQTALDLATHFGSDPGVVVALMLNRITLEPGEAVFLPAGNVHSYLEGVGVEVLANSDNVVRGGLTTKHTDVEELLAIVDSNPTRPDIQRPDDWNHRYRTDVPELALHRYEVGGGRSVAWQREAPAIALVTSGRAEVDGEPLAAGEAVFLAADDTVSIGGEATVHLATTG